MEPELEEHKRAAQHFGKGMEMTGAMYVNAEKFANSVQMARVIMENTFDKVDYNKKFRIVLEHDPESPAIDIYCFTEE